jgi:hypothetical protein
MGGGIVEKILVLYIRKLGEAALAHLLFLICQRSTANGAQPRMEEGANLVQPRQQL